MEKLTLYFLGLFFCVGAAYGESLIKSFKADQIKNLKLSNSSGDVRIDGGNSSEAKVHANKIKWSEDCTLEMNHAGDVIEVSVTRRRSTSSFFSSNDCRVNFQIMLPSSVNISVKNGAGNLEIFNVTGNSSIELGSGDLKMDGLFNTADIKVGSGDVDLTFRKIPATGGVKIRSGSGDALFKMPSESRIKVNFKSGSGNLTSELDQLQDAPFSIFMRSGSGDLKIKKL